VEIALGSSGEGWVLSEATAINNAGQIAGWGFDPLAGC
jgi:hypothetical protein